MKRIFVIFLLLFAMLLTAGNSNAQTGCTTRDCHAGILDIVPETFVMMQQIKIRGQRHGDPDGCVVCHGGNPRARNKKKAHKGVLRSMAASAGPKSFYPDPGALGIVDHTCGVCHIGYGYRMRLSLMHTGAGMIQAGLNAWGIEQVKQYRVPWGNDKIEDTNRSEVNGAFPAYQSYMADLSSRYPEKFPLKLEKMPVFTDDEVMSDPKLAAFTFQRRECQRCHLGGKGRQFFGEHRGLGCSACHMPYAADGLYKGRDVTLLKKKSRILKHRIQGNQKTGGIPVDTCNTCHNGGKQTGVSYKGWLQTSGAQPFDGNGNPELQRYGKKYLSMAGDLHYKAGLLCQDCHTSMDIHGDGNIPGTTLAQVEIECCDCHGTVEQFPWDLAPGAGDAFGRDLSGEDARGVSFERLMTDQQFGEAYPAADGFLLSARGNPLPNVVKSGEKALVYSATGKVLDIPLLKALKDRKKWTQPSAQIAMADIVVHLKTMECYACHASWAPQAYGRYIKIDYQARRESSGTGRVTWDTAYRRWENPVLGMNGEGWVSPLMPGSQVAYTIVSKKGKVLVQNKMPLNSDEAAAANQTHVPFAADTAPAQPHTIQKKARSCESCHMSEKTAGMGFEKTGLSWSKIVDSQGTQLATVGTHWPLSRSFDEKQITSFLRTGTCMGCHFYMKDAGFWEKVSTNGRLDKDSHEKLMGQMLERFSSFPGNGR